MAICQLIVRSRAWLLVAGLSLVLLVGYFDWLTGPEISLTIFYLIPIALVTWFGGRWQGYSLTVTSVATRYLADIHGAMAFTSPFTLWWNETLGAIGFLIVMLLVAALHDLHGLLEQRVQHRTQTLMAEISERSRAQAALRTLARELSAVEEAERRRLATDLHDSIGQNLSLLKLKLEPLARQPLAPDGSCTDLTTAVQLVDSIIEQARTLMFDLHPAMLDDLGLVPTLRWYAEKLDSEAQVTVAEVGTSQPLAGTVASYLFRAVKELVSNAIRHGQAREIVIAVHWQAPQLKLVIDDDGRGFDPAEVLAPQAQSGLGLASIRERLASLGGQMFIESAPGEGTRVGLEVPLGATPHRAESETHDPSAPGRRPDNDPGGPARAAGSLRGSGSHR